MPVSQFFTKNIDVVFFFYGLAFLILGIIIIAQLRITKKSNFKIVKIIWLLAWFGIIHGINEFIDMFEIIKGNLLLFKIIGPIALLTSYLFIFYFGYRLVNIDKKRMGSWFLVAIALSFLGLPLITGPTFYLNWNISARYFLGFPGALLSALGFVLYYKTGSEFLIKIPVKKYFVSAAVFFAVYGVIGGLMVPKANILPASLVNSDSFLSFFGVPVQVIRAICATGIAWSMWHVIDIFNIESMENLTQINIELQRSKNELELRVRERTEKLKNTNIALEREIIKREEAHSRIAKEKSFLSSLLMGLADGFAMIDCQGKQTFVNSALCEMTGFTKYELENRTPPFSYWAEEGIDRINKVVKLTFQGVEGEYELIFKKKTGERITVLVSPKKAVDSDGNSVFFATIKDVTDRKRAEEALKESEEKFTKISDSAYDVIVMIDDTETILFWNNAAEKIFGYSREEALGKKVHSLIMPEKYHEAASKGFEKFKTNGKGRAIDSRLELSGLRKGGSEFPVELSLSSVKIKDRWNAIGLIRDITERKKAEEDIKHLAYYDSLTGLPNRKMFSDRFNVVLANAELNKHMFALLFLDLDGFKNINDRYGHDIGDLLLKQVGKRLAGGIRQIDTVARMGGDEFATIISRMNKAEDVARVANKTLTLLSGSFNLNGYKFTTSASIGISIYPLDGKNLDVMLSRADIAMYRSKATGKNKYEFYSDMNQHRAA